jgi:hypothetical protein
MRRSGDSLAEEWPFFVAGAVAALWRWRFELVLVLAPLVAWRALVEQQLGPVPAAAAARSPPAVRPTKTNKNAPEMLRSDAAANQTRWW